MAANVFSIPPGAPFLPTLARAILDGGLVAGFRGADDPLALAGLTVFVPTRRAARALSEEFARSLGGRSAILPLIRPLGEADDESLFRVPESGASDLTPVIDPIERRMLIARLVRDWKRWISAAELRILAQEDVVLPASPADALWLAGDLCSLFDQVETQSVSLARLSELAPAELAEWWQLTLTFLQILTEHWPSILRERGLRDGIQARNEWLRSEAERYRRDGSSGPVVIAGSTASAPAILDLMRAVAHLGNGAVVLPGLDRDLDEASFGLIDLARSIASPGHPQYALKAMLQGLLVSRETVRHLGAPKDATRAREAFVSNALRPAASTELWGDPAAWSEPGALDGLALIEAVDEREEALAIAVAMRDALSDPQVRVALTTPNRNLARRVISELERFGIAANDSAGRPLAATAPGTLASLVVEVALNPGDPIRLIALLKHPLARFGLAPAETRRAARALEIIALRGGTGTADAAELADLYARRRAETEADRKPPRAARLIHEEDRDLAGDLAAKVEAALLPLTQLRGGGAMEIAEYAVCLTEALEAVACDPDGKPTELYAEETGAALARFLTCLVQCPDTGFSFEPRELPHVLRPLIADETVRPRGGLSRRVFVWGALEARLQDVDVMVLGGLNEGVWPAGTRSDAFLSRLMRADLALDPPEWRIGLAAHDFQMALGNPKVVMTRSARAGGAPTIPSRWVQRLLAVAGAEGAKRLRAEGGNYLRHARALDRPGREEPAPPPAPRPPLDKRPTRISITEVETLIRDPYAYYARHVLFLESLPDLIRSPNAAERGKLYHRILARFVEEAIDPQAEDAVARLIALAREEFDREALPADIRAVWWPRMETLAEHFVGWERERNGTVAGRFAECGGTLAFPDIGVELTGYADRIDRLSDGSVEILDFKTGTSPSAKQARTLLSPQLPLEGAMARLGAFESVGPVETVADLVYVRLREKDFYEERLSQTRSRADDLTGDELSDRALEKFRGLAATYRNAAQPYLSRARPFMAGDYSGDYDHLARAREWAAAGEEEGETGGSGG